MRSILAGLRQLIVPWGSRTAPRIVIGGEDPILVAANREAGIVFYLSDTAALVHAIQAPPGDDLPQYNVFTATTDGAPFTAQILDVIYEISSQTIKRVDVANDGVDVLGLGLGAAITDLVSAGSRLFIHDWEVAFSETIAADDSSSVATYNGATFQDIPGAPTSTFVKKGTNTRIKMEMHVTAYTSANFITPRFGLELDDGAGTVVDTEICGWRTSWTGREQFSGVAFCSDATMAPGTYTVTPRWRKAAGGAGDIGREAFDDISYCVSEVTDG